MSKIDIVKFHEHIKTEFTWMGQRCKRLADGDDADSRTQPDVVAAAILMSTLIELRELAVHKVLGPKDIQVAIDAAYEGAAIIETRTAMGSIVYKRKEAT